MDDGAETETIRVGGQDLPLIYRRNDRARRIVMRLDRGRVVITLPGTLTAAAARAEAGRFITRHLGWIERRLAVAKPVVPFLPGSVIPYRGVAHRIVHEDVPRGVIRCGDGAIHVPGLADHLERRLTDWLRGEARSRIDSSARPLAAQIGLPIRRIVIRDTRSRWGSCSAAGDLSFSWRLILAPPQILDYVVAHEVAHLREMNHGPRFWRLCADLCDHWRESRAWLSRHGAELHLYGG